MVNSLGFTVFAFSFGVILCANRNRDGERQTGEQKQGRRETDRQANRNRDGERQTDRQANRNRDGERQTDR